MFLSVKNVKILLGTILCMVIISPGIQKIATAQSASDYAATLDNPDTSTTDTQPATNTNDTTLRQLLSQEIPGDLSPYNTGVTSNDITADIAPQNPGSFERIDIQLDSNLVDIRRYQISWYLDGVLKSQGIGKMRFSASTKDYGQSTVIDAVIAIPAGSVKKTITLTPQDISTMWEAVDSYVPPFYQGKKLPSRESVIKVVAIPNFINNGVTANPNDLVYNWKRNDNVLPSASAYGASSILIQNNKLNASEILTVTASSQDGSIQGTANQLITFFNPKIIFYAKDDSTGTLSPFARNFMNMGPSGAEIVAEPYFFSVLNKNPNKLNFSWTINKNPVTLTNMNNPQLLTLQNPGGSGIANLGLSIKNPRTVFQSADAGFRINFSSK